MLNEEIMNIRVGENVRKYRKLYSATKEELPQRELAERIGTSTALIGALESKKSTQGISLYNLWKISQVLEVPIDKFFE